MACSAVAAVVEEGGLVMTCSHVARAIVSVVVIPPTAWAPTWQIKSPPTRMARMRILSSEQTRMGMVIASPEQGDKDWLAPLPRYLPV